MISFERGDNHGDLLLRFLIKSKIFYDVEKKMKEFRWNKYVL